MTFPLTFYDFSFLFLVLFPLSNFHNFFPLVILFTFEVPACTPSLSFSSPHTHLFYFVFYFVFLLLPVCVFVFSGGESVGEANSAYHGASKFSSGDREGVADVLQPAPHHQIHLSVFGSNVRAAAVSDEVHFRHGPPAFQAAD